MMKIKCNVLLWKIFACVCAISLLTVIVLCVGETQENIPAVLMSRYTAIGLIVVSVIALAGVKLEAFLTRYEKILLLLFFLLYTIVIVRFTLHSRGIPVHDSYTLISGAKYMAGLTEEMSWNYFGRWNHNIMPMIFLSMVFRVAKWAHISDGYYLALALNIIQVLCTLFCVYKLGYKYSKYSRTAAWLGMGMMAIFIPIWGQTQALYTDSFSFGFGIIAFYIWNWNYERRGKKLQYWLTNFAAGIIWAIGAQIKATVLISVVAVFIYLVLFEHWKVLVKNIVSLLLPIIVIGSICSAYIGTLPSKDYADTWGVPPIGYFIGVGLEGNGGFDAYTEYFLGVTGIYGMEEKKAFSNEFILTHLDRFWDAEHMTAKVRHNFASGSMRADDFMHSAENQGFLYNCVSFNGAYHRTYITYATAYWYMLLGLVVIACVLRGLMGIISGNHRGREIPAVVVPLVSIFGILIYVMVFEANNRQLYNHLPMIFCAANIGIWSFQNTVEKIYYRIKEKI